MTTPIPTLPTLATVAAASALLTACGGGGDDAPTSTSEAGASEGRMSAAALSPTATLTPTQAWRFLTQGTMGPTLGDIQTVQSIGYQTWLTRQFAEPVTSFSKQVLKLVDATNGTERTYYPGGDVTLRSAWMKNALSGTDQLRQRVVFALSEIMVISTSGGLVDQALSCASYLDYLAKNAFGTMRNLLADVSRHPAMGRYLTHFGNDRPRGESHPDQNYAREVLQLFSIGVNQLEMSGRNKLDTVTGKPIAAYTTADIIILSHVFTGWSFPGSTATPAGWPLKFRDGEFDVVTLNIGNVGFNAWYLHDLDPRQVQLMTGWDYYHAKQDDLLNNAELKAAHKLTGDIFDGSGNVKLLGQWFKLGATPQASLDAALTILLAHPNVAPFIAKQMIQRLVTSNPSDGFVSRAATAFKNSGLNLKTLVQTILLDSEARTAPTVNTTGKIREPLLRVTHVLRAFGAASKTGDYVPYDLGAIGQHPMRAPSVFNFFRPGFRAPNTEMARLGKVAPEMQIINETTVATYINTIHDIIFNGIGLWVAKSPTGTPLPHYPSSLVYDVARYKAYLDAVPYKGVLENPGSPKAYIKETNGNPRMFDDIDLNMTTLPTGATAAVLVDWVKLNLTGDSMSTALRNKLIAFDQANVTTDDNLRARRLILAVMVTPEYLIQK
jgi:uncharacterized protein (DUF1800 family)